MELWIRSQDKEKLLKANDIGISNNAINEGGTFSIYTDSLPAQNVLGRYKTEERAIEVLDEIQDRMLNSAFAKKINGLGEELDLMPNPILIYNMPEN